MDTSSRLVRGVIWCQVGKHGARSGVPAGKDFLTSLIEWEIKAAAYEVASGDRISEAAREATIMDHSPDAVKSMLRSSPLEQRRSVDALSSYATPGLFHGSMPMPVGAVSDGGKGKKGKSKSTGDKGKGKGKDKNNVKGNDGDKNKERDDWNNGQRQAKFQGYLQWLAFKNLNLKLRMSKQHNGVTSTVKTWTWIRRVGALQR